MNITVSRELAASATEVWSLALDWERQYAWMPATTVRILPGLHRQPGQVAEPGGVGTRLEATTGFGPFRIRDPMRVEVWDPPRRCVTRHEGRVLRGTGTFEVEPTGAGRCRFTWSEDLEPPAVPVLRTAGGLLAWPARPFFAWALRRLDRLVREGRMPGPPAG